MPFIQKLQSLMLVAISGLASCQLDDIRQCEVDEDCLQQDHQQFCTNSHLCVDSTPKERLCPAEMVELIGNTQNFENSIHIGVLLHLQPPVTEYASLSLIKYAFESLGQDITLHVCEVTQTARTQAVIDKNVESAVKLLSDNNKVVAIIGPSRSSEYINLYNKGFAKNIAIISHNANIDIANGTAVGMFRTYPTASQEAKEALRLIHQRGGPGTDLDIGLIYDSGNVFGQSYKTALIRGEDELQTESREGPSKQLGHIRFSDLATFSSGLRDRLDLNAGDGKGKKYFGAFIIAQAPDMPYIVRRLSSGIYDVKHIFGTAAIRNDEVLKIPHSESPEKLVDTLIKVIGRVTSYDRRIDDVPMSCSVSSSDEYSWCKIKEAMGPSIGLGGIASSTAFAPFAFDAAAALSFAIQSLQLKRLQVDRSGMIDKIRGIRPLNHSGMASKCYKSIRSQLLAGADILKDNNPNKDNTICIDGLTGKFGFRDNGDKSVISSTFRDISITCNDNICRFIEPKPSM